MSAEISVNLSVNGAKVSRTVEARRRLGDFLREDLGLTGTHLSCEHGVCGACTVRLDGRMVRGCLLLAVQAQNARVETIEGASDRGDLAELQAAFHARNALQCGFCTAGMLIAAAELIEQKPHANRDEIRKFMSGNYCRCTGYQAIVDSIADVLEARLQRTAAQVPSC